MLSTGLDELMAGASTSIGIEGRMRLISGAAGGAVLTAGAERAVFGGPAPLDSSWSF